jgi:hypothetical protein
MLRLAARDNPDGVVLFSTIRADHLREAAEHATSADPAGGDVEAFARLVAADPPRLQPSAAGADR